MCSVHPLLFFDATVIVVVVGDLTIFIIFILSDEVPSGLEN